MEVLVSFMSLITVVGIILGVLVSVENEDNFLGFIKSIIFSIFLTIFSIALIVLVLSLIVIMWTLIFKTLGF